MTIRSFDRHWRSCYRSLCALVLAAVMIGCGQTGPLFLPGEHDDDAGTSVPADTPSDENERDTDDKPGRL